MASLSGSFKFKRGSGITLTKTEYNDSKDYVDYKWAYQRRSPGHFIVVLWNVQLMSPYVSNTVWTSQYGNGQGYGGVHLRAFSLTPGHYSLRLVNVNNINDVYAQSSPFWVNWDEL